MKKIYAIVVLLSCNCLLAFSQIAPPYYNDFETDTIGWYSDTTLSNRWQWDTTNVNPCPGLKAWQVGVDSANLLTPVAVLYSPVFDFTNLFNGTVSLNQHFQTEPFQEGTTIEYSVNGAPWTVLGSWQQPNWYNTFLIPSSGLPGWTGTSPGCISSSMSLSNLGGFASVQFRFFYTGDSALNPHAYIIDDFCICDSPCVCTNSVGINQVANQGNSYSINLDHANDQILIEANPSSDFNILLIDMLGKVITMKQIHGSAATIETKNISGGIYLLRIMDGERQIARTIIVE